MEPGRAIRPAGWIKSDGMKGGKGFSARVKIKRPRRVIKEKKRVLIVGKMRKTIWKNSVQLINNFWIASIKVMHRSFKPENREHYPSDLPIS
jgi:hypothetical protein